MGALLFAAYCVGTLALPVLAAADPGSPTLALWLEQAVNTTSQGPFALASVRLVRQSAGAAALAPAP